MFDLDLPAITGLKEEPELESISIDLARIKRTSAQDALKYLVAMRTIGIGSQFSHFHRTNDSKRLLSSLVRQMYYPINPLLLITAVCISIVRDEDFRLFLSQYARGLDVPGIESLIRLDVMEDQNELQKVLSLEDEFRGALINFGTEIVIEQGNLIEESGDPTMLDLYWACWIIANPMFKFNQLPARSSEKDLGSRMLNGWNRGIQWGFEYNSPIHNAREHYEYLLAVSNSEVNSLLSQRIKHQEKRTALQKALLRQHIATLLVERSQRFYYWAPHEMDAHSAEVQYGLERIAILASSSETQGDIEAIRESHLKFYLPPEMLKRLKTKGGKAND